MQSLIDQKQMDGMGQLSFMSSLDAFMHSVESMQLLTGSSEILRQSALQTVMRRYKYDHPLVLNAGDELTTDRLLTRMREHGRFQIPVQTVSFRSQIKDYLQACQEQVQQGLLIITEAHRLPITTQAALMYLSHLQEKQGVCVKVVLISHPVLVSRLGVFSHGSVREARLSDSEQFFLQWMTEQVQKRQQLESELSAAGPCSQASTSVIRGWTHRRIISALAVLALVVGVATHGLHHTSQSRGRVVPALRR